MWQIVANSLQDLAQIELKLGCNLLGGNKAYRQNAPDERSLVCPDVVHEAITGSCESMQRSFNKAFKGIAVVGCKLLWKDSSGVTDQYLSTSHADCLSA